MGILEIEVRRVESPHPGLRTVLSNKFAPGIPLLIGGCLAFAGPRPWSELRNTVFFLMLALSFLWAGYQEIWLKDNKGIGAGFFWGCGGMSAFALNSLLRLLSHK
jgi:hypothetical protein